MDLFGTISTDYRWSKKRSKKAAWKPRPILLAPTIRTWSVNGQWGLMGINNVPLTPWVLSFLGQTDYIKITLLLIPINFHQSPLPINRSSPVLLKPEIYVDLFGDLLLTCLRPGDDHHRNEFIFSFPKLFFLWKALLIFFLEETFLNFFFPGKGLSNFFS